LKTRPRPDRSRDQRWWCPWCRPTFHSRQSCAGQ